MDESTGTRRRRQTEARSKETKEGSLGRRTADEVSLERSWFSNEYSRPNQTNPASISLLSNHSRPNQSNLAPIKPISLQSNHSCPNRIILAQIRPFNESPNNQLWLAFRSLVYLDRLISRVL